LKSELFSRIKAFEWENIKIWDLKKHLNKRITSEMLNIHFQTNSLNLQSDTEFLYDMICEHFREV